MAIAVHTQPLPVPREQTSLGQAVLVDWYHETLVSFLGTTQAADALLAEVFTQAQRVPNLLLCTMDSVRFAIGRIAALRLNPALPNEVFLVPRNSKQADGSYAMEMTLQYGYGGLRKLALRSPEVLDCFTHEVCVNDVYESPTTPTSLPTHRLPHRFQPRGRVEGYYAVVQLTNGNWRTLQMSVAEVEAHAKRYVHDMTRAPAWQKGRRPDVEDGLTPFDKMALKTCLRMLLNGRDVPLSDEIQAALQTDADLVSVTSATQEDARIPLMTTGQSAVQKSLPEHIADLYGDVPTAVASVAPAPAPLHPLWAQIQQWYTEAGSPEKYPEYCDWACRQAKVTTIGAIPSTVLLDLADRVYATLAPRIAARQAPPQAPPAPIGGSVAWDTLTAHADDPRLPDEVREQIAAALSPLAPASESEALALAGVILDTLNATQAEEEPL